MVDQHQTQAQAQAAAAKEQLAKDEAARKKQAEQREALEGSKPTPTQDECDRAKLGEVVDPKEEDGSPPDENNQPIFDEAGHRTRSSEPKQRQPGQRSGDYATRSSHPTPPRPPSSSGSSGSSSS